MKNLLTLAALFLTLHLSAQTDTLYCIQVMSTRNPELVKPEMVSAFDDIAMIEQVGDWWRIMFVYEDRETAEAYLYSWQRQHKDAFVTIRTRQKVDKMLPLFTYE